MIMLAVSGYLRAMEDFAKIAIELVARHLPRDIAITIIGEYIGNTWDCGHTFALGKKPKKLLREATYMKGPPMYSVCEDCLPCHYCGVSSYTDEAWHATGVLGVSF